MFTEYSSFHGDQCIGAGQSVISQPNDLTQIGHQWRALPQTNTVALLFLFLDSVWTNCHPFGIHRTDMTVVCDQHAGVCVFCTTVLSCGGAQVCIGV